jgi:S1-C subfamily serine protease
MICGSCGGANAGKDRFCTTCGAALAAAPPPSPLAPPRVYVHSGPDRGRSFPLVATRTIIGRGTNADIQLTDSLVSSRHLAIEVAASRATVTDLDSANGTKVAGQRLSVSAPYATAFGTMVELGDTIIEIVGPDAQPQAAAPTITRTSRGATRFRRRSLVTVGAVAIIAVIALVVGIAALNSDSNLPPTAPVASSVGEVRDPSWVMRTQNHSALQVFACEGSSEKTCEDTIQGGTGSVLDLGEGLILTNFHVIADDDSDRPLRDLWVAVSVAGEDYVTARTVGFSACDDLAVLKIVDDAAALNLAQVELGEARGLEVGDPVVVLGYPGTVATDPSGDQQLQLTAGNISALGVVVENYRDLIQMSAPINSGNSGGPVFDLDGRQIGVATLGDSSETQGIFYAISIDHVNRVLPKLRSGSKQIGLSTCPS